MKIVICTVGTTGDLMGLIAIALGLQQAGFEVTLASHNIHKQKVSEYGINFATIGTPINIEELNIALGKTQQQYFFKDYLVNNFFLKNAAQSYENYMQLFSSANLIICHYVDFVAQWAATQSNLPWVSMYLFSGLIPTKYAAPAHLPNLGILYNRFWWHTLNAFKFIAEKKMHKLLQQASNNYKTKPNLAISGGKSPYLNLVAASKFICTPQPDFNTTYYVTGAWSIPELPYTPPPNLQQFIEKKTPDVVFTLGSMGQNNAHSTMQIIYESIKNTGLRAVILKGWSNMNLEQNNDNVFFCSSYVPFYYLFKHCKIVVHHGGAGTTHDACRFARPSIVIPHIADQPYFAKRLYELGVATKPIVAHNLSAKVLTKSLQKIMQNDSFFKQSKHLANNMATENGVNNAIKLITPLMQ